MRRHPVIGLLVALALLLSACSGDDGDGSADRDVDESDQAAGDEGGDAVTGFTSGECGELSEALAAAAPGFANRDPDGPSATEAAEYLAQLAESVPDDLEADVRVFAAAFEELAEAAEEAGVDFNDPATVTPEALQEMGDAFGRLSEPEVQEASERIREFAEEACGASGEE